jgi:hypothetical protein
MKHHVVGTNMRSQEEAKYGKLVYAFRDETLTTQGLHISPVLAIAQAEEAKITTEMAVILAALPAKLGRPEQMESGAQSMGPRKSRFSLLLQWMA